MREITIEITRFCENNCNYCSSDATPEGVHLKFSVIENFLKEQAPNIERINISGGEPLSHPQFYQILQECKKYTKEVWVYTNAIEKLIYNTDVISEVEVHANVCLEPGTQKYIPKKAEKVHLLKMIPHGRAINNYTKIGSLSLSGQGCDVCRHQLLQADGQVVAGPCGKNYNTFLDELRNQKL